MGTLYKGDVIKRSDCILVYGSTTKGDVVKRSDCILVYGSTTKGDVVKRSDCILVYGRNTKGDVVKGSDNILVCWSTTKGGAILKRLHTACVFACMHACVCAFVYTSCTIHNNIIIMHKVVSNTLACINKMPALEQGLQGTSLLYSYPPFLYLLPLVLC